MSMSGREIWIPPVPALPDVGTFTSSPALRRAAPLRGAETVLGPRKACVGVVQADTGKKTGPVVPRLPAPGFPIAHVTGPCSNSGRSAPRRSAVMGAHRYIRTKRAKL